MRDVARLARLSAPELADLLRAAVLLPRVALALRRKGLRGVQEAIERSNVANAPPRTAEQNAWRARQAARIVAAAARRAPLRATCLARSLTLQWILRRHGIESQLRLGVRKVAGHFEAHAWLEHQGEPLMEPADVQQRFAPFQALARDPLR